jgi:hypothetical protein
MRPVRPCLRCACVVELRAIALQLGCGASGQSRRNSESSVLSFLTISAIVSAAKVGSASAAPAIIRSSVMPDLAAFLPPSLGENETTQANSSQRDVRRSSADQRPFVVRDVLERVAREARSWLRGVSRRASGAGVSAGPRGAKVSASTSGRRRRSLAWNGFYWRG